MVSHVGPESVQESVSDHKKVLEKDFMVAIERFSIDSNDMGSLSQVIHHSLHSNDSHGRLTEVVRDHCG